MVFVVYFLGIVYLTEIDMFIYSFSYVNPCENEIWSLKLMPRAARFSKLHQYYFEYFKTHIHFIETFQLLQY